MNGGIHELEHHTAIDASAETVYELIADVGGWPVIFPPTVHVEHICRDARHERFRIWATANDTVRTWTSAREFDRDALRVRFRQETPHPPVASMGGEWIVERLGQSCVVRLLHDYSAVDDNPEDESWITQAVNRNSAAELRALKIAAETAAERASLTLTFEESVRVDGNVADVYGFVNEAGLWARRLPHVATVRLTEETPGVQMLEMDTLAPDGETHSTTSVRVCFPQRRIVYKQSRVPALMAAHTGQWRFEPEGDAMVVASTHTVALAPEAIPSVLGEDASVDDAKHFLRSALGRNSTTTMLAAKAYAEARGRSVRS